MSTGIASAIQNEGQYANVTGGVSQEEMVNICSTFDAFKAFMVGRHGEDVFNQGFAVVQEN